jgi:hypothetical protein
MREFGEDEWMNYGIGQQIFGWIWLEKQTERGTCFLRWGDTLNRVNQMKFNGSKE